MKITFRGLTLIFVTLLCSCSNQKSSSSKTNIDQELANSKIGVNLNSLEAGNNSLNPYQEQNVSLENKASSRVREFIKYLYSSNLLFKKKSDCFTEGTFVFEDK